MTIQAAISYMDSFVDMHDPSLKLIDKKSGCCDKGTDDGMMEAPTAGAKQKPEELPIFLNNEAPLHARSLNALAIAMRRCTCLTSQAMHPDGPASSDQQQQNQPSGSINANGLAVITNDKELGSRNMVLSAYTLIQQESAVRGALHTKGHSMVIAALDAFLENDEQDSMCGFSDSQIQNLLLVCQTTLEIPVILYHPGNTYHMVTNSAILLAHYLNAIYAIRQQGEEDEENEVLFEEVMHTFLATRKILQSHRRRLPSKVRCHSIPRVKFLDLMFGVESEEQRYCNGPPPQPEAIVDIGEVTLCACPSCHVFVLRGCGPCVAAERILLQQQHELAQRQAIGAPAHEPTPSEAGSDDALLAQMMARLEED